MKLAIATWNGRVSPVFDVARQAIILDIEDGRVTARRTETLPGTTPQAQACRLVALGVQVLICGAVSHPMSAMLAAGGMEVISFTAGDVEPVLEAWLAGNLPAVDWRMPGCCGRMRRCRGGNPGGRGRERCGNNRVKRKEAEP